MRMDDNYKDWVKLKFMIALFGSEFDEDGISYTEVYKWELKEFIHELRLNIDYVRSFAWNLSERYNYYRSLLIMQSRQFWNNAADIRATELLDELAFKLAQEIY